jgi:hypothetical protein
LGRPSAGSGLYAETGCSVGTKLLDTKLIHCRTSDVEDKIQNSR